jgi:hypothetical protein
MPPAGFEPTIPVSEWTLTYTLDCVVTEIGRKNFYRWIFIGLLDYS